MTTRSTPASSISGTSFSMVNGSGNCGLRPGTHFQSGGFRLPQMRLRIDDRSL